MLHVNNIKCILSTPSKKERKLQTPLAQIFNKPNTQKNTILAILHIEKLM